MIKKARSICQLADQAGLDTDEAIIRLWDNGFHEITAPSDIIKGSNLKRACRALGIPTFDRKRSVRYWRSRLGLSQDEFKTLLSNLGVAVNSTTDKLPKNVVAKLRAQGRQQSSIPSLPPEPTNAPLPRTSPAVPPMQWHNVGHERNIRFLTVAEVETIHAELVADFSSQPDPIFPPGVKSKHLLASAVFHPHTALGESHKYPTVEMSAAAMLHAIVHNHPFHNGNKRTALVSMLVFLDKNGLIITCDEDEIFRIVLRLGKHGLVASDAGDLADREILEIAEWIRGHSRLIRSGEKPLPFRKLWQLLIARDCAIDGHGSSGSKVNISRTVLTRKPWWNPRSGKKTLRTQVHYIGEGREMSVGTISKIRCDLELDETHGVDSAAFYEDSPTSPSTFIEQYRKTLDRLAGL